MGPGAGGRPPRGALGEVAAALPLLTRNVKAEPNRPEIHTGATQPPPGDWPTLGGGPSRPPSLSFLFLPPAWPFLCSVQNLPSSFPGGRGLLGSRPGGRQMAGGTASPGQRTQGTCGPQGEPCHPRALTPRASSGGLGSGCGRGQPGQWGSFSPCAEAEPTDRVQGWDKGPSEEVRAARGSRGGTLGTLAVRGPDKVPLQAPAFHPG